MIRIAPSLVSASLLRLEETVVMLEENGADILHFDIEDGSFVPVMNLGTRIIQDLRPITPLPFDVHLMMVNPEWLISELADFGVQSVSVHIEACPYPRRTLGLIAECGMKAGLAFNPKTDIPGLAYCHPFLSYILLLTTEPETKTCSYLPSVLEKLRSGKLRSDLADLDWYVDGGITSDNAREVREAGADVIISGRGVFQEGRIRENIRKLKSEGLRVAGV
jgi:ribulose-phosphate 3-epimerase